MAVPRPRHVAGIPQPMPPMSLHSLWSEDAREVRVCVRAFVCYNSSVDVVPVLAWPVHGICVCVCVCVCVCACVCVCVF